jgi:hypothetical protein
MNQKVGKQVPHFEIQVSAVKHFALRVADKNASAGLESGVLVHEVDEE